MKRQLDFLRNQKLRNISDKVKKKKLYDFGANPLIAGQTCYSAALGTPTRNIAGSSLWPI